MLRTNLKKYHLRCGFLINGIVSLVFIGVVDVHCDKSSKSSRRIVLPINFISEIFLVFFLQLGQCNQSHCLFFVKLFCCNFPKFTKFNKNFHNILACKWIENTWYIHWQFLRVSVFSLNSFFSLSLSFWLSLFIRVYSVLAANWREVSYVVATMRLLEQTTRTEMMDDYFCDFFGFFFGENELKLDLFNWSLSHFE